MNDKPLVHALDPTLCRLPAYHHYLFQVRQAGRSVVSYAHECGNKGVVDLHKKGNQHAD